MPHHWAATPPHLSTGVYKLADFPRTTAAGPCSVIVLGRGFAHLHAQHSAVEGEINSLEHHGLNRCLDVGLAGYKRYVGLGVMSYNLYMIGRELLRRERQGEEPLALAA